MLRHLYRKAFSVLQISQPLGHLYPSWYWAGWSWWWWWWWCVRVCEGSERETWEIHHIDGLTAAICRWYLGMSTLAGWVFLLDWLHFPLAFSGCRPWDLAQAPPGPLIQEFTTHLFCGAALPFHSRNFCIYLLVYLPSVHFCPSFLPIDSWSKKKGHFPIWYPSSSDLHLMAKS